MCQIYPEKEVEEKAMKLKVSVQVMLIMLVSYHPYNKPVM